MPNTQTNEGYKTFTASGAITRYTLVKLTAADTVAVAGAGDDTIGVAQQTVATTEPVSVKLWNSEGSFLVTSAGSISAGSVVYPAASGQVSDTVSGNPVGKLNEAGTASALVEMIKGDANIVLPAPGTVTANQAVVVDANKDAGDFRNLDCTNLDAGASGTAGSVDVFPSTASKGKLTLACTDQTGDTAVTINANAMGQATTVNLADPGAAASYLVQSTAALTLAEVDVLDAVTAGTVAASKAVVVDANKDASGFRNITASGGTVDCGNTCEANAYTVGGVAGVDFGPAAPASITVVKGIVTAASA